MKTPVPEPEAEDPQAQQIDLDDADVSAELASDPRLPPGAPALPAMPPLPPSVSAPPAGASVAPPPPSRSPMFYVGVLAGVLVLSAAVGTAVALSRRRAPAPVVTAPGVAATAAPKVITIGTVEMDDNPDGGP